MPTFSSYNQAGLNQQFNPLLQNQGEFIQLVNCDSQPFGAKTKRPGYGTYLSSLGTTVDTLFTWQKNNGTQFWNYGAAGGSLFYSQQGTGAWTICGNGTITNGTVFNGVLEDTMVITTPTGTTRHTTDGTSFTDTTSAPVGGVGVVEYQNRIWIPGTSSSMFYSTTGTPTDWTSDSSSIAIPGAGKLLSGFKSQDRQIITKNSGQMFRWDGFSLVDLATDLGPSSPRSITNVEDFRFYLNRRGYFGFGGGKPELISNQIQPQIYNNAGSGIAGTVFDNAPSGAYKYDVYTAVGTVTDDLTDETINNCIQKYNYQLDEWTNHNFANLPTAFNTYKDASGVEQFIFGDSTGQCYTYGGTNLNDNGAAITAVMQMFYHGGQPYNDKKWKKLWMFFNPGCQASIQVSCENTFNKDNKNWINLDDATSGVVEYNFPPNTRSKLLFIKISESSTNTPFTFYGLTCDFDIEGQNR